MFETLPLLPLSFWVVAILIGIGSLLAINRVRSGTGLPTLAVLATVGAWYIGDVLYNDYVENHLRHFSFKNLDDAWWQVAIFLVIFLFLAPVVHGFMNPKYFGNSSFVMQVWRSGVDNADFQDQLARLFYNCVGVWAFLALIAIIGLQDQVLYYFFPFLGQKMDPWGRGRVGGAFDALSSLGAYYQLFVAGAFGVIAALIKDKRIIFFALLGCLMTWPYYLFDRSRNQILAVTLPAMLTWIFIRYRGNFIKKAVILAACFMVVEAWMAFVLINRVDTTVSAAFGTKGISLQQLEEQKHDGLNMYEELCWINTLMEDGSYEPNWGQRYFAELVNPIPRGVWADKPFIGIDYSIARGQSTNGKGGGDGGVYATVSTGMIGQGVVNFGRLFGPAFAAILMTIWVAVLARLDLTGQKIGHLPLYLFGIILTFNLGRDITFITLYSFCFGWLMILAMQKFTVRKQQKQAILVNQPIPSR